MAKKIMSSMVVVEFPALTLEELVHAVGVSPEFIQHMIDYGIIEPEGTTMNDWRFDAEQLRRTRKVAHLAHDLEINMAGAALILDLMEEIDDMRAQLDLFEKHFSSSLK